MTVGAIFVDRLGGGAGGGVVVGIAAVAGGDGIAADGQRCGGDGYGAVGGYSSGAESGAAAGDSDGAGGARRHGSRDGDCAAVGAGAGGGDGDRGRYLVDGLVEGGGRGAVVVVATIGCCDGVATTGRVETVTVATPFVTVPVPITVGPLVNVTVPVTSVGSVSVKVTESPTVDGFCEEVRVEVGLILVTVWVVVPVAVLLLVSPP